MKNIGSFAFMRREPLGVVCATSPFNCPLLLATRGWLRTKSVSVDLAD